MTSSSTRVSQAGACERRHQPLNVLLVAACGFACMIAYSRMLSTGFVGYLISGGAAISDPYYALRAISEIVTFALLSLIAYNKRVSIKPLALIVSIACMIGSTIVIACASMESWVVAPCYVMASVANALVMYTWMLLLSTFTIRSIVVSVLGGVLLAAPLMMVPGLGREICLIVAAVCAFISGVSVLRIDTTLQCACTETKLQEGVLHRIPWLSVILVLSSGFLGTALYAIAYKRLITLSDGANIAVYVITVLVALTIVVYLIVCTRGWSHFIGFPSVVILALAILSSCFVSDMFVQTTLGLLLASVFCSRLLYWIIFPALFTTLKIPRGFLVGLLLICANGSLASLVGGAVGSLLPMNVHILSNVGCAIAVIVALILVGGVILSHEVSLIPYRIDDMPEAIEGFDAAGARRMDAMQGADTRQEAYVHQQADALHQENGMRQENAREQTDACQAANRAGADIDVANGYAEHISAGEERETAGAAGEEGDAASSSHTAYTDTAHGAGSALEGAPRADETTISLEEKMKQQIDAVSQEYGLTKRETEVVLLTAQGFSCAYISQKLVVSNSTVRFHQQNAYRKLGVHSRNELIEFVNAAQSV